MIMDEKKVDLKKMSFLQLEELKDRQLLILKNRIIVKKLADNGAHLRIFLKKIEAEIEQRKTLNDLEAQMKTLDLNSNNSPVTSLKYVQHMCNMERNCEDLKFKPFRSYLSDKEKVVLKETSSQTNQYIALKESVELQAKQAVRTQEELVKLRHRETIEINTDSEESTQENESDYDDDDDNTKQ